MKVDAPNFKNNVMLLIKFFHLGEMSCKKLKGSLL